MTGKEQTKENPWYALPVRLKCYLQGYMQENVQHFMEMFGHKSLAQLSKEDIKAYYEHIVAEDKNIL